MRLSISVFNLPDTLLLALTSLKAGLAHVVLRSSSPEAEPGTAILVPAIYRRSAPPVTGVKKAACKAGREDPVPQQHKLPTELVSP